MRDNSYKKRPLFDRTEKAQSFSQGEIHNAKSEPNELTSTRMHRTRNMFQHVMTEMPDRTTCYSFAQHRHAKVEQEKQKYSSAQCYQKKMGSKAIIHDSFSKYLANNYKTFRIGINTVAIKKKLRFQKDGIGQLACNMAQIKPINFKVRVEPQQNQKKSYLRQMHKSRNQSSQLNEWAKKLEILERVHTNRLSNGKSEQLPGISSRKKRKAKNEFKPWSNADESRFTKIYPAIDSGFDLYDIIQ